MPHKAQETPLNLPTIATANVTVPETIVEARISSRNAIYLVLLVVMAGVIFLFFNILVSMADSDPCVIKAAERTAPGGSRILIDTACLKPGYERVR